MPAALASNRPMQSGDSQPWEGACFNPISRLASAAAKSTSDVTSSFSSSPKSVCCRGSSNGVAAAAISPGTTLIRNSHGQDQVAVIQPPTTGPIVGASTATTPAIMVARPCSRGGNSRNTAANTAGISTPPEKPCTMRKASSTAKPPLTAQPTDAIVKTPTAVTNNQRSDSTRVIRPVRGIAITSAIR